MTTYVALLRAINVGGTGLLSMKELTALCVSLGFPNVRTYIQSGNVVFASSLPEQDVKMALERALIDKVGRPVGVLVRTAEALRAALAANPFPEAQPAQVGVLFLAKAAPVDLLAGLVIPGREEVCVANREIFIHYPDGMGRSKLKLPAAAAGGTMRNLNTVTKLAAMALA